MFRGELQRELALRRELEEEGERAREEREERARVIARELGEAMRQRDQAAHTAHSLETALKSSQVGEGRRPCTGTAALARGHWYGFFK